MPNAILEVEKLCKSYRSGFWNRLVPGLVDLDLTIYEGEVFGLLGPNGAGKTTFFKLATGLLQPTSGRGTLMGKPLSSASARLDVGYLPENPAVYDFLSGNQFLNLMGDLLKMPPARKREQVAHLLELVGLSAKQKLVVRKYSKGMVQRLALAQALLNDPPVVILDEPMSGLDPVGRKLVRDIILDLRARGRTVIFSSHVLSDAEALCDRVGLMLGGRLKDVGAVATLVSERAVSVEVVVDAPALELPEAFNAVKVNARGGQTVLTVAGDDALADKVVAHIVQSGLRLVTLQRHRETLEGFFVRRAAEANNQGLRGAVASS